MLRLASIILNFLSKPTQDFLHLFRQTSISCARFAGMYLRNFSMFRPVISFGNPRVAFTTCESSAKKFCAIWLVPGSSLFRLATKVAFAVLVELEVNATLRENSAFEFLEDPGNLRVLSSTYEPIL